MDAATYRKIDPETFRHKLSYHTRLANPPRAGLELSEAREAGQRTQRAGHIILAKERPASYKKKPIESAEPLYWPMKAALCFSQLYDTVLTLPNWHTDENCWRHKHLLIKHLDFSFGQARHLHFYLRDVFCPAVSVLQNQKLESMLDALYNTKGTLL